MELRAINGKPLFLKRVRATAELLAINCNARLFAFGERGSGSPPAAVKRIVLHHSDRGSQYCSNDYQKQLKTYEMDVSMSRKGNCYENACIDSFHSILKKELIYLTK